MDYRQYLEEVGLADYQGDLRILDKRLQNQMDNDPSPSNELLIQSIAVSSICEYPDEWGYEFPIIEEDILVNEEVLDKQETNPITYFGRNPPKKYKGSGHTYAKKIVPRRLSSKKNDREENLWKHRRSNTTVDLGPLTQKFDGIKLTNKAINDRGEILNCDNPETRLAEIASWENAMDIAIGQHGKDWDVEQRLAYMISSLGGLAKATWEAISLTREYEELKCRWIEGNGTGPFLGNLLRIQLCGRFDLTAEKEEDIANAKTMLANIECCDMRYVKEYSETFLKLYIIAADLTNQDLLHSFYLRLPSPWNRELSDRYTQKKKDWEQQHPGQIHPDGIGYRIKFLEESLAKHCFEKQIARSRKVLPDGVRRQVQLPKLRFGCNRESSVQKRRSHHKRRRKKFKIRHFKKGSQRPKFVRKRKTYKKKEPCSVKCYGCQQIGHYANKCPTNSRKKAELKAIEEELELVLACEYESESDMSSYMVSYETDSESSSFASDFEESDVSQD